ncbi:FAD-dependent oxidoreductase [Mycolicibacterium sphagni]|uniref:FAD-binding domain-containing protein n=1 Tax=Mycolicibacterium sphagni TaxID=1786 RepID=A0ABX2JWE0_9MYCO|nr:hypothetical protein [Mycolicibacterium sphagni]NTY61735.1 hypothetical protein [Mycolicibacterium sphagni]
MSRHAVISGAGIAGPTLAHHPAERGWRTTVIERFAARRDEGQNIDVRGAAREVARRMGVEDAIHAANTGEVGMRFLRDDGSPAAAFPMSASGEIDGPTAEFEILRGELSRTLRTVDARTRRRRVTPHPAQCVAASQPPHPCRRAGGALGRPGHRQSSRPDRDEGARQTIYQRRRRQPSPA